MTLKGESPREDPVNILHCCGGHEDHIDSCPMLWDDDDWNQTELDEIYVHEQRTSSED